MTDEEKRKAAKEAGYSDADIDAFLSTKKADKAPPAAAPEPVVRQATLLQKMLNATTGNQLGTSESSSRNVLNDTVQPKMEEMADTLGRQMANPGGAALLRAMAHPRDTAAIVPRYGGALLSAEGGPSGAALSGGGEALAQQISGESDPRAVAVSAGMGAVPLAGATKVFSGSNLLNAMKLGGANYGVNKIADKIAEAMGVPKSQSSPEKQAALVAGVSALSPVLGKMLGKVMGNVAPEEVARIEAAKLANGAEDATLAKWQPKGAVINPSKVKQSFVNDTLGAIAGIQNVGNEATRLNTPLTDAAARREAQIPANTRIDESTLALARQRIAAPVEELRSLGGDKYLTAWDAANNARQRAQSGVANGVRGSEADLASAEAAMSGLQQKMDQIATQAKRPDLVGVAPRVQQEWAKNFDVERMTPTGTGHLDPSLASAAAAQRGPGALTGELRDIAQLHNLAGAETKNVNNMSPHGGTLGPHAAAGAVAMAPTAAQALVGGLPLVRAPIRDLLLSQSYQRGEHPIARLLNGGAVRNYAPRTSANPEITAALTKLAAAVTSKSETDKLAEMVAQWKMQQALQNQ